MSSPPPYGQSYQLTGKMFPQVEAKVIQGVIEAKNQADEDRRTDMGRRVDLFRDDFRDQLIAKLNEQYQVENFTELQKTLDVSNNVCKKIITDISTIYDEPAAWKLAEDDKKAWLTLRRASNLDLAMPVVNQMVNLCNECLVRIAVVRGRMRYHPITPDLAQVWENPDDPTTFDAVRYLQPMYSTPDRLPVWQYWSNGGPGAPRSIANGEAVHAILDLKGRLLGDPVPNPYRDENGHPVIPIATYHRSYPVSCFWDSTSGFDVVDGTLMIAAMETMLNFLFRADSAQIKWISGEVDGSTSQVAGPTRFLVFRSKNGDPLGVGQFKSQADWQGLRNLINDKLDNLCTSRGLARGAVQLEGTPQSGFALKVRKEALEEARKRQIPLFQSGDRELYAISAAVWNFERKNARGDETQIGAPADGPPLLWPSKANVEVTYGHFEEPMTAAEEETALSLEQARLSMGLTNMVAVYQDKHPDATEEEARKAIEENNKINRELASGTMLVVGRAQILNVTGDAADAAAADLQTMSGPGTTNKPPDPAGQAPDPAVGG